MITFKEIKYFITVSEELNFRKAAKRLNISQPPLSQQIMTLEEKLNFKLFVRNKKGVKITLAGKNFLNNCYDISLKLNNSIETGRKINNGEVGNLKIGFSTLASFNVLPNKISNFLKIYPKVELNLIEMRTEKIVKELKEKKIDIGFAGKKIIDKEIKGITLSKENIILAINKNNHLAKKKNISITDIKNEKFILFPKSKGAIGLYDRIIEFCQRAKFEPNVIQEAYEIEVILGLVSGGLGVALIPENAGLLKLKNIIFKNFKETPPKSEIYLLMKNNNNNSLTHNFFEISKNK